MDYITLKSKRQNNGLWGIPMNVSNMKLDSLMDDEESKLFSAIIMGVSETHGNSCTISIEDIKMKGYIKLNIFNSHIWEKDSKMFISLDHFGLIGNKLYFIRKPKNKLMYDRMLKLKNIKQNSK